MNRIDKLNDIIDRHIDFLEGKDEPNLSDTKTLTEILKSILVLEQIKNLETKKTVYDSMNDDEMDDKVKDFE